jgi:hypothetical protein
MPEGTARSLYERLESDRAPFLARARNQSQLTIPGLIPPTEQNGQTLSQPFQSVGARGVNNLAGKLLLTLLPPQSSFFRLLPDQQIQKEAAGQTAADGTTPLLTAIEAALSDLEESILKDIEKRNLRASVYEGVKHLIVGGNVLLFLPKRKNKSLPKPFRVFPLSRYVVQRDPEGTILDIVVKECVSPRILPTKQREEIQEKMKTDEKNEREEVDIYTWVTRTDEGSYKVHQECYDIILDDSEGTYPEDKLPWLPLRWSRIDGENYGRALCEEYYGDITSLESLSQSVVEGSAAAARVLILVNPNGHTKPSDLARKPNLSVVKGHKDDITVASLDKFADFQVAASTAEKIERRLEQAFLLHTSVQRDAERVTAEEIRYLAKELEDALGGVYSILSGEFQLPLVTLIQSQMESSGDIPPLPSGSITPTIVTGIDALGRTQEQERLDVAIMPIVQVFPDVGASINTAELMRRRLTAYGVKADGLIKSDSQMQAERQAAMQSEVAQKLGPAAIKAVSDHSLAAQQQTPTQ